MKNSAELNSRRQPAEINQWITATRELAKKNRLDPEIVEIFVGNYTRTSFAALNRRSGKTEPIRNLEHLERLLLSFCHAHAHQSQ